MPLNDDPEALTDEEYAELAERNRQACMDAGEAACSDAPPLSIVAAALARLDLNNHG
jgi:hypothetical protein